MPTDTHHEHGQSAERACKTAQPDRDDQLRRAMPPPACQLAMADMFKVLGDATRVGILSALAQAPMCVGDIARVLGMTQSAISHQLRILKQARLIKSRREGRFIRYSLADAHVELIFAQAMDHILE